MKVAVIGATGRVGPCITRELSVRGHQVTAISKHPKEIEQLPHVSPVLGDANNIETLVPLIKSHDVVVSSIQFSKIDPDVLIGAVKQSGVPRYVVVGGSGTLLMPGTTTRIMDTEKFPTEFANYAASAARFFEHLRREPGLNWTFLSPPPGIGTGERTGEFRLGLDEVLMDGDAFTTVSFEDYAIAFVDEVEQNRHSGRRFTVGY